MAHVCDRGNCPPAYVSGPKAQCFACKNQCFLACFGFSSTQATAYKLGEEQPFTPMSNIQFIYTGCLAQPMPLSQSALNDSLSLGTPKVEKTTIKAIALEVAKLQEQFASFQQTSSQMNGKLDSIELKTNDIKSTTQAVLEISKKSNDAEQPVLFGSPSLATRAFRPPLMKKTPSYASVTKENGNDRQFATPSAGKRRRFDTPKMTNKKPKVPTPKMGTGANVTRLVAVTKAEPKKIDSKPKFEKSVWVSRLARSVTEGDIRDHIATNTSATSNFTVRKLIKKDSDVSTLTYISFKIDFDILNDPAVWPKGLLVREFFENKPATLGDFLSANLNAKQINKSLETMNVDLISDESPSKNANAL